MFGGAGMGGWQWIVSDDVALDDASFLGTPIKIDLGLPSLQLGTIGIGFQWGKLFFMLYYIFCHLFNHWGAGRDGCRRGKLDDISFLGTYVFFEGT
jgi:hypothetical protein